MRITGGLYKGRRIICPPGEIRPAMDRMRESVFAVLGDLTGFSFLDLFSGSGIIGLEAASRGAEPVVLVEEDRKKIATLKKNISFVTSSIRIKLTSCERFLVKTAEAFDYIFLDPPFNYQTKAKVLEAIALGTSFSGRGLILLHLPTKERRGFLVPFFKLVDERHYGGSTVLFFSIKD